VRTLRKLKTEEKKNFADGADHSTAEFFWFW